MNKDDFQMQCMDLHIALSDGDSHDISCADMWTLSPNFGVTGTYPWRYWYYTSSPWYLNSLDGCFPKTEVMPVTLALAEQSFLKVNIIKTYLRTTMAEERLGWQVLQSIKKALASSINCNDMIWQQCLQHRNQGRWIVCRQHNYDRWVIFKAH
jgi:hypothetical protein